ncbi:EAL domain-containing protein [Tumebacillus sp. ITR2]|uniref:EAL domain-containing protein n=1 Tax=Tumebacillus amylolyticus TaxID=2801339 RepID=A0ABS1J9B3_9BACL|nr:EAL domain-containing protein [Tumebacillus amylolyticus]MBL0386868.1 EAL domain-containing protein [Tumebacillus amylolyticus]
MQTNGVYALFVALVFTIYMFTRKMMRGYLQRRNLPNSTLGWGPRLMFAATAVTLVFGYLLVLRAEAVERRHTQEMLAGLAPTMAYELKELGHWQITTRTPPDDPHYLLLIEAMKNWTRLNPQIDSMYTMRQTPDGQTMFVVAPETDYNRDGVIDSPREQRVPIGTRYDEDIAELDESFHGRQMFQSEPNVDFWGESISAFVPIYRPDGRQDAIFGVDFSVSALQDNLLMARASSMLLIAVFLLTFYSFYIMTFLSSVARIVERHRREIKHQAYHDALTGLPNRVLFKERVGEAIDVCRVSSGQFALLFLDLDRFKMVNDTLGHSIGDLLLVEVAGRLQACVSSDQTVARLGGDEFVVLLPCVLDLHEVTEVAHAILEVMQKPFAIEEHELFLTTSIGVAIYPLHGVDVDSLVQHADTAMYRAKEKRNQYCVYETEMNEVVSEKWMLERNLRGALERGEFLLHYQPKLHLQTGRVLGAEALVRWQHPELGLLSPAKFIPLAEETGEIIPLGRWVLREACRQLKAWHEQGMPELRIAVNLSMMQFQQKDIVEEVRAVLEETGLSPQFLELELTESIVMQSPQSARETLMCLSELGVQLSIDDFGTGYSSLSYLRSFPVDKLKIAREFIHDIPDREGDKIVNAVIQLAHNLQLQVIAEGVETQEQMDMLRLSGCDEGQGYLFCHPVPPEEFAKKFQSLLEMFLV